jgi:antitoxin component of RelBE/YafQ-DinJ toxin-antitoxin module
VVVLAVRAPILTVKVPEKLKDDVFHAAAVKGISVSVLVRMLLKEKFGRK